MILIKWYVSKMMIVFTICGYCYFNNKYETSVIKYLIGIIFNQKKIKEIFFLNKFKSL